MEYSTQTQIYLEKYNISFPDLLFCTLIAAGLDPGDSYHAVYKTKSRYKNNMLQNKESAKELLRVNPAFNLLIREIKNKNNKVVYDSLNNNISGSDQEITEQEKERYLTREGLIGEMIKSLRTIGGKDSVNVIQTLAKLQGLDKPDENEKDEKRRFVLRWLSHCRTCKLMRAYLDIQNDLNSANSLKSGL